MSFNNRNYNTRNSGRFNSGQFVSAGERNGDPREPCYNNQTKQYGQMYTPQQQPAPIAPPTPQQQTQNNFLQDQDMDMKPAVGPAGLEAGAGAGGEDAPRPAWMKNKLMGVKKISNKERRRRQNESLRKLLSPKNALMVLNEMIRGDQLANQFKVEAAQQQYYGPQAAPGFCADLTLEGSTYKGYGENKLSARNAAAEQAIRDLIIKRMTKALGADAGSTTGAAEGDDDEALPMIQLASFALHKLFAEWEYEGHKVPLFKPANTSVSEQLAASGDSGAGPAAAPARARPPKVSKPKVLPSNAARMHPCMLLTYMRPRLDYRELSAEGDKPQNMIYTVAVDVDSVTYIGKATNKKEARKMAARAACEALFSVKFEPVATANAPEL
ncbi:uncharacterized protein LOC119693052 isoform X2 [Plutella xylostella]|uniref:uncharacterized protein LOC119693052 isoform X2 n=1 Tax=Plutella xylostella TaxID=51655 RepID=UPI00203237C8|nr:uncharacterized protein LOC119693052 isoform X2 [Plutella xylostella]